MSAIVRARRRSVTAVGVGTLMLAMNACGASSVSVSASVVAGPASWALRADPQGAARDAGLPLASMAGMGAMAAHFHVHVDLIAGGSRVPVPAGIGIEPVSGDMTDLHTHDATGLVHVEAMGKRTYTLGQLFTEWGQPLDSNHVGSLTADAGHPLTLVVNGTTVPGNPALLTLADHQEIALVYGRGAPSSVPTSFDFSQS